MTIVQGWYRLAPDGNAICIFVYAQPNARNTEITGLHDGRLKVRLAAPALDGRANDLLLDYIRRRLDVPANRIALLQGHRSRMKTVEITMPTTQQVAALQSWLST